MRHLQTVSLFQLIRELQLCLNPQTPSVIDSACSLVCLLCMNESVNIILFWVLIWLSRLPRVHEIWMECHWMSSLPRYDFQSYVQSQLQGVNWLQHTETIFLFRPPLVPNPKLHPWFQTRVMAVIKSSYNSLVLIKLLLFSSRHQSESVQSHVYLAISMRVHCHEFQAAQLNTTAKVVPHAEMSQIGEWIQCQLSLRWA